MVMQGRGHCQTLTPAKIRNGLGFGARRWSRAGPTTGHEFLGNKMATNHGDGVGSDGTTKFANSISSIPLGVIVLSNRIVARR